MKITANPKRQSAKTAAITATTIRAVLSASPLVPICCSRGFAPECSLLSDEVFLVSPVGFPVRSSGMSDFTADVLWFAEGSIVPRALFVVEIPALDGAMWGVRGFFVAEALFVVGASVVVGALRALEGSVAVGGAFVEKRPPVMGDTGENFFVERFILDGGLLDILGLRVAFGKETRSTASLFKSLDLEYCTVQTYEALDISRLVHKLTRW